MKCANPNCHHGIGLMSYQRGLIGKRRYCSKTCRDSLDTRPAQPRSSEQRASTYFEWLFLQPIPAARLATSPAMARIRMR